MWFTAILNVLGLVAKPVTDYFAHKMEITKIERQGEIEIKKATIDATIKKGELDSQWEVEAIRNNGWKDEWLTIVLSVPLVGCFIPGFSKYITEGFAILQTTPGWYQAAVGLMIAATFGIKKYAEYMMHKNGADKEDA